MANDDVIFKFLDKGTFHGVPARDLTQRDLDRLDLDKRRDVRAGTLYRPVTKPAQTSATKPPKGDDTKKGGN